MHPPHLQQLCKEVYMNKRLRERPFADYPR